MDDKDNGFFTQQLNIPAVRYRGSQPARYLQTGIRRGQNLMKMLEANDPEAAKNGLSGYSVRYNQELKQLELTVTALKRDKEMVQTELKRISRSKSIAPSSARKSSIITKNVEMGHISLSALTDRTAAAQRSAALRSGLFVDSGGNLEVPSGIAAYEKYRKTIDTLNLKQQPDRLDTAADTIRKRRFLEAQRHAQAIKSGRLSGERSSLFTYTPEAADEGITKDFVDKQNTEIRSRNMSSMAGKASSFLGRLVTLTAIICAGVLKLYALAKQGAASAHETTVNSLRAGVSKEDAARYNARDQIIGLKKGTKVSAIADIASKFGNAALMQQNLGSLKGAAIFGEGGSLVTKIADYATKQNGETAAGVYEAILSEMLKRAGNKQSILSDTKYKTSEEAMSESVAFMNANGFSGISEEAMAEYLFARMDKPASRSVVFAPSSEDIAKANSLYSAMGQLASILDTLKIKFAAWVQEGGWVDAVNRFLMAKFGDKEDIKNMYASDVAKMKDNSLKLFQTPELMSLSREFKDIQGNTGIDWRIRSKGNAIADVINDPSLASSMSAHDLRTAAGQFTDVARKLPKGDKYYDKVQELYSRFMAALPDLMLATSYADTVSKNEEALDKGKSVQSPSAAMNTAAESAGSYITVFYDDKDALRMGLDAGGFKAAPIAPQLKALAQQSINLNTTSHIDVSVTADEGLKAAVTGSSSETKVSGAAGDSTVKNKGITESTVNSRQLQSVYGRGNRP